MTQVTNGPRKTDGNALACNSSGIFSPGQAMAFIVLKMQAVIGY